MSRVGQRRHGVGVVAALMAAVTASALPVRAVADEWEQPEQLFTRTSQINALVEDGATVWVGTRGGLEARDATTLARRRLYTTRDGLAESDVRAVELEGGRLIARTPRARCTLDGERFTCVAAPQELAVEIGPGRQVGGHRVTAALTLAGQTIVGTASDGLWVDGSPARRVTGDAVEVCSNHVVAFARFAGRTWLGSFDEGLCSFDGERFRAEATPFRMVNDLAVAGGRLWAASPRGLFFTRDGARWHRLSIFDGHGAVSLAVDGPSLWAASVLALARLDAATGDCDLVLARPGRSSSLQAVDVRAGVVWLASEDRGALRMTRADIDEALAEVRRHRRQRARRSPAPELTVPVTRFDRASGLPSSWATDIVADAEGGAWVASLRSGMVHVSAAGLVERVAGLPDTWLLHATADGAGGLFVGTQGGAAHVEGARISRLAGLPHSSVHAFFEDGEHVWVGTEGGTAIYRSARLAAR